MDLDCFYSCYTHYIQGSQRAGVHGFNINTVNLLAAVYTATGQDIACLHDSAFAYLEFLPVDDISHQTGVSPDEGILFFVTYIGRGNITNKLKYTNKDFCCRLFRETTRVL